MAEKEPRATRRLTRSNRRDAAMMSIRSVPVLTLLCAAPAVARGQTPWPIAPTPVTDIGGVNHGPDQELYKLLGARRLTDGRVVVLNGKPLELRIYSAAGALLKRIGRAGNGPGEFGYDTRLIDAAGDSIVTFTGDARWQVFGTDGAVKREWTVSTDAQPRALLFRRAVLRPAGRGVSVCARTLINRLPVLPAPALRELYADDTGRFWVHQFGDSTHWEVYTQGGALAGTVLLPPGFRMYQVAGDLLIGRVLDADDLEHVVAYRMSVPGGMRFVRSPACATTIDSFPITAPPSRLSDFRTALRMAMTAEEGYFSDHADYARTASVLRVDAPPDAKVLMLSAEKYSYVIGVFDDRTTLFCGVAAGPRIPAGWLDYTILCGN